MKVTLDSSVLNGKILKPLSRIVDDCILTLNKDTLESIATVTSGGIIIYTKYNIASDILYTKYVNADTDSLAAELGIKDNEWVD